MNMNRSLTFASILCFASVALAQQNADALKQRVLSQAQNSSADDYAFTRTIRSEQSQGGKTEKKVTVERFDPTKPADARWTLVSVDGAPPSADTLNTFRKEVAKRRIVPGYHRIANYFGAPATASTDSRGRTVFRFASLPKGSVTVLDTDVSESCSAEALLGDANGTPFVEQMHFTVKPMRLKLVMKLQKYETTAHYRMGPDGKPQLVESTSELSGSGMGQEGTMRTTTTYSDYRAAGAQR
ncbi:MAG: hypothetical protein ACJ8EL_14445 [Rhizomicrobium sp.]